jgi:hypothetical protein
MAATFLVSGSKAGHAGLRALIRLSHGVTELVQCMLPHRSLWFERDERLLRSLSVVQYGISLLSLSAWCDDAIATFRSG